MDNTKIVQVINAMITNYGKITNVIRRDKEFFFLYNDKYKWSIAKNENDVIFLHIYPGDEMTLEELSNFQEWGQLNYITFNSTDLKTKEADESFNELYQIVSSKLLGLEDIFEDILSDF